MCGFGKQATVHPTAGQSNREGQSSAEWSLSLSEVQGGGVLGQVVLRGIFRMFSPEPRNVRIS